MSLCIRMFVHARDIKINYNVMYTHAPLACAIVWARARVRFAVVCNSVRPLDSPVAFETLIHGIDIQPPSAVCVCCVCVAMCVHIYICTRIVCRTQLGPSRVAGVAAGS